MKVSGDWMTRAETQAVCRALTDSGRRAWFVGGCVRNALLGEAVADVDIATDAVPARVIEIAQNAGLRSVPTGIDHGTITVISGGVPFEVTTLRRDVETFGRHATVAFSTDLTEDAARRDFTMNALYATPDGAVLDPLGGLQDLMARRVRFVGDADARIAEDYLRILRFFRFYAWYGDPDAGLDADGLAACAANADGIDTLSRERVGAEMRKLLSANDPAPAVAAMAQVGVLAHVLPGADAKALPVLVHLEVGRRPHWLRRLAALSAGDCATGLRLSRADAQRLEVTAREARDQRRPAELGYRHGYDIAADIVLVRSALTEVPLQDGALAAILRGAEAKFPLRAADLMPAFQGSALGARLAEREARWIASDFHLTREELLA
ncbi:CCA-adding enzyme [mine drainage metagenome]|uniref:CCA-adding enzyme n=1 Tax=mine drainage metagenome TaxID=410659 RepID=A0A1J5QLM9_9ZZZZ